MVLEVVRMAVNEQFPSLMPTVYPGSKVTDPKPYASLDKMWKAFGDFANNKTHALNGDNFFFHACLFVGSAVIRTVGAPAGRSWTRPGPSGVSDAFMADGIEQ